jgi:NAD(P)-dependent dehydrogenase (short-subunit alcohol dehydrogenase family)
VCSCFQANWPIIIIAELFISIRVFIADRDEEGAQKLADELNKSSDHIARVSHVDAANWNSQAKAFSQAVAEFGRIDYVYPIAGIGERPWIPNDPNGTGFVMPDLSAIDVDLTGVLYTVGLAVQQFRRQEPGQNGFRGKSKCCHALLERIGTSGSRTTMVLT